MKPSIRSVVLAVWGCARRDAHTGSWVMDMTMNSLLRAVCAPSQINGPFGDGHVDLVYDSPSEDFDPGEKLALIEAITEA